MTTLNITQDINTLRQSVQYLDISDLPLGNQILRINLVEAGRTFIVQAFKRSSSRAKLTHGDTVLYVAQQGNGDWRCMHKVPNKY